MTRFGVGPVSNRSLSGRLETGPTPNYRTRFSATRKTPTAPDAVPRAR